MRPRKLSASIKDGKEQINAMFIKVCSFGNQNVALDDKGHAYVWGIK